MPRLKRTRDEAELDLPAEPQLAPAEAETRSRLRNMWEFASLMQYIFLFGSIIKVEEDFDIEDLEAECLKPTPSERLAQIGLQFLKYVSSHRGLTLEIFDEYTRRQFVAKAPLRNPYGVEEEPAKFNDFDIYTKIRVLHQLSLWTMINTERFRGLAEDDEDQTFWRMEPLGWDRDDRAYYVLDDNRLYRRADEPVPPPSPPKPKSKAKKKSKAKAKAPKKPRSKGTRASKRLKLEHNDEDDEDVEDETMHDNEPSEHVDEESAGDTLLSNGFGEGHDEPGFGFTAKTWECVAVTLDEYQDFMATLFRSKDPNEVQLRKRLEQDVLPIIEKRAEQIRQKEFRKLRELENLQKMATAKRSSRLADKADREKEEREKREAEEKQERELKMAREEEARQRRIEEGHESRRQTREQRLKEREVKRILHENTLRRLQEQESRGESQGPDTDSMDGTRVSKRQNKAQREHIEKELNELVEDEDKWYFDCSKCGMHGENLDDGTHSIACDKCGVWQHSKCHNIAPEQAERDGFAFVCKACKRKEEDAKRPRPTIKLSKSPTTQRTSPLLHQNGPVPHQQPPLRAPENAFASRFDFVGSNGTPTGAIPHAPVAVGATFHNSTSPFPPVSNFAPRRPSQSNSMQLDHSSPPPAVSYQHQQQHYAAHQGAVSSAGGHAGYRLPLPPGSSQNGAVPNAPPFGQPPYASSHQLHNHRQAPDSFTIHQYHPNSAPRRPSSSHASNFNSSPVKPSVQPMATPPQHFARPVSQHMSSPAPNFHLPHSPKTTFPPPVVTHAQNGYSPIKSSPPPQPMASSERTPQALHPPIESGSFRTPQPTSPTNGIAMDGMSGPWPRTTQIIPQKHDQSPLPPSSSQSFSESKILPPIAALAPSPMQQAQSSAAIIPIKKLPEENGLSPIASMGVEKIETGLPEMATPTPTHALPAAAPALANVLSEPSSER